MFRMLVALFVATLLPHLACGDDAREKAQQKDRQQIAGTWQVTSLIVEGRKVEAADTEKMTVVNGTDGTWSIRLDGKEVTKGTSTFDPTKTPKTIDFTPTSKDSTQELHLGIYELGQTSRKICFAPAEKPRPTEFSSTAENGHFLVTFERIP